MIYNHKWIPEKPPKLVLIHYTKDLFQINNPFPKPPTLISIPPYFTDPFASYIMEKK